jgi:sensor histidine kinase regulating citrate/malate metabolism
MHNFAHHSDDVHISEEIMFLVSINCLIINIAIFVLHETMSRESEKNYVLIAQNKQYELTEQHNSEVIEIYTKMREWRHDYNNHMQLLVNILERPDSGDNINEAVSYIKNLDEKIKSSSLEIVTGNYIVDAIVSAKATLAHSHNISFEHNIYLPDGINIESTDLCSILSNLLDNAIEACCKIEQGRYINLEIIFVKTQLNIKIINAANGEYKIESGKFKTTKPGDLHGIGMGQVKSIVENYGGFYDVDAGTDSFTTQISIPLHSKQ